MRIVLAAVLCIGLLAPVAQADLIPGQRMVLQFPDNGQLPVELHHGFTFQDVLLVPGTLASTITVTSFELPPPEGKKFAGQIDLDFSLDTPGILWVLANSPFSFTIIGVKNPAELNLINTVDTNIGEVTTDGFNIFWQETAPDQIITAQHVTITWTQVVPAPGSLALLGLAGLSVGRRRRRHQTAS